MGQEQQRPPLQPIGDFRGVHLHAGHAFLAGQGGLVQVLEHRRRGPDQHQPPLHLAAATELLPPLGGEQGPDRQGGDGARRAVGIQQRPPGVSGRPVGRLGLASPPQGAHRQSLGAPRQPGRAQPNRLGAGPFPQSPVGIRVAIQEA